MSADRETAIPIAYSFEPGEGQSLPQQKEGEVKFLQSLIAVIEAYGGKDVEIGEILVDPDSPRKVVTLIAKGDVDVAAIHQDFITTTND